MHITRQVSWASASPSSRCRQWRACECHLCYPCWKYLRSMLLLGPQINYTLGWQKDWATW